MQLFVGAIILEAVPRNGLQNLSLKELRKSKNFIDAHRVDQMGPDFILIGSQNDFLHMASFNFLRF